MKTHRLSDILPPRVRISKNGSRIEISGNEKLMEEQHVFTFTSAYDFEKDDNDVFFKETDDHETEIRIIRDYLQEQGFEYFGDSDCQKIIDRLDYREKDFHNAKEHGVKIKTGERLPLEIPSFSSTRKLKDYQLLPVQHMLKIRNAANFSIPGSGKTTMTYAVYDKLKSNSKIDQLFVVGPLSSLKPWEEEYANCFGVPYDDKVLRYVGTPNQRAELAKDLDNFQVILTNIPIVNNDFEILKENLFDGKKIMLVLDESHHIKSFAENATYANTMIDIGRYAQKRIILTGTPMPHSWPDLWSQITFLYPDERVLGSRLSYKSTMERIDAADHISDAIDFLWTRVTRKQMEKDLPKMKTVVCNIPLSPIQTEIYQALENDWVDSIKNHSYLDINEIYEFKRVKTLRLLQCVTNPGAVTQKDIEFDLEPYETDNAGIAEKLENYKEIPNKMMKAADLAMKLAEKGKNVIIWTVFRYNVKYLCDMLSDLKPIGISGEIPMETKDAKKVDGREDRIRSFKNGKGKIMVATLGSIAESVSLHRNEKGEPVCQDAIYLERNFNAGQFMQSLFRLYRIGSDRKIPVNNIFLSSMFDESRTATIDNEVHERLLQRTKQMFRLMDDEVNLAPLNVDVHSYVDSNGVHQFYDELEERDTIYNKIEKMIRKHQKTNKV